MVSPLPHTSWLSHLPISAFKSAWISKTHCSPRPVSFPSWLISRQAPSPSFYSRTLRSPRNINSKAAPLPSWTETTSYTPFIHQHKVAPKLNTKNPLAGLHSDKLGKEKDAHAHTMKMRSPIHAKKYHHRHKYRCIGPIHKNNKNINNQDTMSPPEISIPTVRFATNGKPSWYTRQWFENSNYRAGEMA